MMICSLLYFPDLKVLHLKSLVNCEIKVLNLRNSAKVSTKELDTTLRYHATKFRAKFSKTSANLSHLTYVSGRA